MYVVGENKTSYRSKGQRIHVHVDVHEETIEMVHALKEDFTKNLKSFKTFKEDAEKTLYLKYKKYTKLSAVVNLYNVKTRNEIIDKEFTEMLHAFMDYYHIKLNCLHLCMNLREFMKYEKIYTYLNDCILYRKEYMNAKSCHACGNSRWKIFSRENSEENNVCQGSMVFFSYSSFSKDVSKLEDIKSVDMSCRG